MGHREGLTRMANREIDEEFTKYNPNYHRGIYLIFTEVELNINKTAYSRIEKFNENPKSINSAFFFTKTLVYERRNPNYNIVAHELAHILANQEHNEKQGNILSEYYDGMDISADQCDVIYERWKAKLIKQ